jgi:hypothetical protein
LFRTPMFIVSGISPSLDIVGTGGSPAGHCREQFPTPNVQPIALIKRRQKCQYCFG